VEAVFQRAMLKEGARSLQEGTYLEVTASSNISGVEIGEIGSDRENTVMDFDETMEPLGSGSMTSSDAGLHETRLSSSTSRELFPTKKGNHKS